MIVYLHMMANLGQLPTRAEINGYSNSPRSASISKFNDFYVNFPIVMPYINQTFSKFAPADYKIYTLLDEKIIVIHGWGWVQALAFQIFKKNVSPPNNIITLFAHTQILIHKLLC